jgi:excisionase family DNA binding protein
MSPRSDPAGAAGASRILADLLDRTSAADLPDLIAALAAAQARALARLVAPSPPPAELTALLGAAELAARLGLAESWVRDAARRGRIPCIHAGAHLRFDLADVLAAMKAGQADLDDRSTLAARGRLAAASRVRRKHRIIDDYQT